MLSSTPKLMKRIYKNLFWAILAGWLVILMVLLAPLFVHGQHEKMAVLAEFSQLGDLIVHHNYDQAYQLGGSDFRDALSYEEFVADQKSLEEKYGAIKAITRQTFEVEGNGNPMFWRGDIKADFVYERQTLRIEIVFHKENGRWVIFGMKQM